MPIGNNVAYIVDNGANPPVFTCLYRGGLEGAQAARDAAAATVTFIGSVNAGSIECGVGTVPQASTASAGGNLMPDTLGKRFQ